MNKLSTEVIHRLLNLWTTRRRYARLIHIRVSNLTSLLASSLAGEPLRRIARRRCVVLVGVLCVMGITPANGMTNADYYKLYLHSRMIDYKQFKCGVEVAHRESRWNPTAVNGNHYGLFQMNNKKVLYMNPYTQIDWWLRYLQTRYQGDACLSLDHLRSKGWQ